VSFGLKGVAQVNYERVLKGLQYISLVVRIFNDAFINDISLGHPLEGI